jgi:hypothetical protein
MAWAYSRVRSGREPWKTAFGSWAAQFGSFLDSSYSPQARAQIARTLNKSSYENDAMAMFVNGAMWNMTGEPRYARKTVQLLDAWDTLCCDFPDGTDFALMFGYGLQFMVYGADLVHDYDGFDAAQRLRVRSFLGMLKDRVISSYTTNGHWPYVPGGWPSWGSSLGKFLMAYSVYAEDGQLYDSAKSYFFRTAEQGADNGTIETAFLGSGEGLEMGRDLYYAQLSLASFLEWSRIALDQGDTDLFEARDGVLGKAMEYLARDNSGDSVAWIPYSYSAPIYSGVAVPNPILGISTSHRGSYRNIWRMAYDYYHDRRGREMPFTRKVIDSVALEGTSSTITDQVGFGDLFYDDSALRAKPDTTAPSKPEGLSVSRVRSTSATLSWKASTDDRGVFRYEVFRNVLLDDSLVVADASDPLSLSGLLPATPYRLLVRAVDSTGNRSDTASILVRTLSSDSGLVDTFRIRNVHSGLVLAPSGAGTSTGTRIVQMAGSDAIDQRWIFTYAGGGTVVVSNRKSGLVLDVQDTTIDTGARIVESTGTGKTRQRWRIVPLGSGSGIVNQGSGLYLDMDGASTKEGGQVLQWFPNGGENQSWTLERDGDAGTAGATNQRRDPGFEASFEVGKDVLVCAFGVSLRRVDLAVVDLRGNVLFRKTAWNPSKERIDLTRLQDGIYVVQARAETGTWSRSFLKRR